MSVDDIRRSASEVAAPWSQELKGAIRDVGALLEELGLRESRPEVDPDPDFPVLVPRSYVARMRRGDPHDPLLRQVLSLRAEKLEVDGYSVDPLRESDFNQTPGLIRKYDDRALLVASTECAVHCRYCFRRHFPYAENAARELGRAVDAIRQDPSIREVVLSGGDPLLLPDRKILRLLVEFSDMRHVERLRIHTRLPVVLPSRVTDGLVSALAGHGRPVILVLHFNHPNELCSDVVEALLRLRASGVLLLNQSVILRGVNDSADALGGLSRGLVAAGVLPYYLHMPDRVAGTAHFGVSRERALAIHAAMRASMSGYLVPRLVREQAGGSCKELVA